MTTKFDKPIARELALEYEGRKILLEILPADPGKGELELFRFRLKGTSAAKHTRSITVRQVLEGLGWPIKVKIPRARPAAAVPDDHEIEQVLLDLERRFPPSPGEAS